jgi:perosamine synthetase
MPSPVAIAVLRALERVLGQPAGPVALHEPAFNGKEWDYVKDCLDTGWVSSAGAHVDRFERMLADYTGARFAVATVNGTAALHVCLKLAGVGPGDEVLVPTLTFIATAAAVVYCGATPHLADSSETTLGLDPAKLGEHLKAVATLRGGVCVNARTGARIAAAVPMHTFGHPVDLDPLAEVCERYRIALIEDAAESLGSYYKGHHTGTLGTISALSFNGNKIVTTGGGGAVLTNDERLGRAAKHLTTTARVAHKWAFMHDEVGYNYRLPNLNAALGCAQLEQLPRFLEMKRRLANRYREAFAEIGHVKFVQEPPHAKSNYWLNSILLDEDHAAVRDPLLEATNARGFGTRPVWTLMHRLPMFTSCPRMELGTAELLEQRLINLPSSARHGAAV